MEGGEADLPAITTTFIPRQRRREPPRCVVYKSGASIVEQSMSLLDICAAIHADNHGIADPLPDERRVELIDYLKHRIEVWTPALRRSETYDNIVRALLYVTIAEKHWSEA